VGAEIVEPANVSFLPDLDLLTCYRLLQQGIILDTYKIRRMGWKALGTKQTCRPYLYQLPPDAKFSEANKPAKITHGKIICEELFFHKKFLQYVPEDLREKSMGPYEYAEDINSEKIDEEELLLCGPPQEEPEADESDDIEDAEEDVDDDGNADNNDGSADSGQDEADDDDNTGTTYEDFEDGDNEWSSEEWDEASGEDGLAEEV
jgi:hypothetical protein